MDINRQILGVRCLVGGTPQCWQTARTGGARLGNVREVVFDLWLEGGSDGFFVIFKSVCGEFFNDNWFQTLEEAEANAEAEFGVLPAGWEACDVDDAIRLREVKPADLEAFFAQQSDPVAWRMVAFPAKDPHDRPAFDAHWQKILADPAIVVRTITRGWRVVGNVLSFPLGPERQVGYWVAREEWGRGIATAALRELLLLVTERPLHARCAKDNVASVRVLTRAGFVVCREERQLSHARGGEIDELFWVLEGPSGRA